METLSCASTGAIAAAFPISGRSASLRNCSSQTSQMKTLSAFLLLFVLTLCEGKYMVRSYKYTFNPTAINFAFKLSLGDTASPDFAIQINYSTLFDLKALNRE